MKEKTKSGFMSKLFGSASKGSCCSIEIEEVQDTTSEEITESTKKETEKSSDNKNGCCCCR